MNYPDNWYCICGHEKKDHGNIHDRWISACQIMTNTVRGRLYVDSCERFEPVDNLTQIEFAANNRGILNKETKV